MSANKKMRQYDNTPHKRRSAPYPSFPINNNPSEEIITLTPSHSANSNKNSVRVQNNNITPQQVFLPDSRFIQRIAENVKDKIVRENSNGSKYRYGPFYLEIPRLEKEDNFSNNITDNVKKVAGNQAPLKDSQNWREMEKLLTCHGCLERLQTPVSSCNNSHYICNDCAQKRNHKCPTCGERIGYSAQLSMVNNMVNIFRFRCKYSQSGCLFREIPKDLIVHEKKCNYQDLHCMLLKNGEFCHDVISLHDSVLHIQNFHKDYIHTKFKLNRTIEMTVPSKVNLERNHFFFRVLIDEEKLACFIESTYYDDAARIYQISVHYVGRRCEANNFIYTIDVPKGEYFKEYRYSNECLPTMPAMDAEKFHPFILHDRNHCFSMQGSLRYNLTIAKKIVFDMLSSPQIITPGNLVCLEK